jgi:hypothetical protein
LEVFMMWKIVIGWKPKDRDTVDTVGRAGSTTRKGKRSMKEELTAEEREAGRREVPGLEPQRWIMPDTTVLACRNCEHNPCPKCKRLVFKTRSLSAPALKDFISSVFSDSVNDASLACSIDCKLAPPFGVYEKLPPEWNTPVRCCQCNGARPLGSWLLGMPKEFAASDHTRCKEKWHPLSENERRSLIVENDLDLANGRITTQEHAEAMPQVFNGKWYGPEDLAALGEEEMAKLAK